MEIRNLIIALIVGPLLTDIDADINISQYKWGLLLFHSIVLEPGWVGLCNTRPFIHTDTSISLL